MATTDTHYIPTVVRIEAAQRMIRRKEVNESVI